MTEETWLKYAAPRQLLCRLEGKVTERKVCLVLAACYTRVLRVIKSPVVAANYKSFVPVMEQYADGQLIDRDFRAAYVRIFTNRYPPPDKYTPRRAVHHVLTAEAWSEDHLTERVAQAELLMDIFGNLFRPVVFDPGWRTSTAVALARQMYEGCDFSLMPILADALQDAGCENDDILTHCRDPQLAHVRGCWVVDLVLGKS